MRDIKVFGINFAAEFLTVKLIIDFPIAKDNYDSIFQLAKMTGKGHIFLPTIICSILVARFKAVWR